MVDDLKIKLGLTEKEQKYFSGLCDIYMDKNVHYNSDYSSVKYRVKVFLYNLKWSIFGGIF